MVIGRGYQSVVFPTMINLLPLLKLPGTKAATINLPLETTEDAVYVDYEH